MAVDQDRLRQDLTNLTKAQQELQARQPPPLQPSPEFELPEPLSDARVQYVSAVPYWVPVNRPFQVTPNVVPAA